MDTYGLEAILEYKFQQQLLKICAKCKSVVCARVSPDQKGQVVQAIRDSNKKVITLAIGDGANDVPMIQRAHIGVGISGLEGLQAVNASDFAIAQFRYLERLTILHGRWTMYRSGRMASYMFYKTAVFCIPQYFLGFYCLMSGQTMYQDLIYQFYNVAYTSIPIMAFSILAQDCNEATALANPKLYAEAKQGVYISFRTFYIEIF